MNFQFDTDPNYSLSPTVSKWETNSLHFPLYVDVSKLEEEQINNILDICIKMGAVRFGRKTIDKSFVHSSLGDLLDSSQYRNSPPVYIYLWVKDDMTLRLSFSKSIKEGSTVYGFDQFIEYSEHLEAPFPLVFKNDL